MHALQMLFKVVQARPGLVWFCTIFGETPVILGLAVVDMMYRLEMSIQVISCWEPFLPLYAIGKGALESLLMPSIMFTSCVSL